MNKKDKKIIVGLSGGLGNQMFQYAAGRALAIDLRADLLLDISWFLGRENRTYALDDFLTAGQVSFTQPRLFQNFQSLHSKIMRRWGSARMGGKIFRENQFQFNPDISNIRQSVFLEGYWQSERYFKNHGQQIRDDFLPNSELPDRCQPLLSEIKASDAICVHIRRGDYVTDPSAAAVHGLCSLDYYQEGAARLMRNLSDPHCFVFSDDPNWVRNSLELPCPFSVVDVNDGSQANWDLHLMSACRHFVIANSSLSWWGAWLGTADDKQVVAPKRWFLNDAKSTVDLISQNWQQI